MLKPGDERICCVAQFTKRNRRAATRRLSIWLCRALTLPGSSSRTDAEMTHEQATPAPEFASTTHATTQALTETPHRPATPWFRKKRFVLPLTLIALLVLTMATYGGGWASLRARIDPAPTSQKAVPAGPAVLGTRVRDGTFAFVVTGMERPGKTLAGKVGKTLTAQGEFVIVRVNVTNIGKAAQSADCQCQLLVSDKGQKFKPSPAILSTKNALKFVSLIEPGTTVNDVLMLFDVAPGTAVANIELHESSSTQGAKVNLN